MVNTAGQIIKKHTMSHAVSDMSFNNIVKKIKISGLSYSIPICIKISESINFIEQDGNEIYDSLNDIVYSFESEYVAKKVLDFSIDMSENGIRTIESNSEISKFAKKV